MLPTPPLGLALSLAVALVLPAAAVAQVPTAADTSGVLAAAVAVLAGAPPAAVAPSAAAAPDARPSQGADSVRRARSALRRSGRPAPARPARPAPPAPPAPAGVRLEAVWRVAPGDALTARVAAALGRPTRPADPAARCPWGAPAGAAVGLTTRATLRFVGRDTADVSLGHTCPSAGRGAFYDGDVVRVVRRGRAWVAVEHATLIT